MNLRKSANVFWKIMRSMLILTGAGFWCVLLAIYVVPHVLHCYHCAYTYHSHFSGKSWDPAYVHAKISEQQKAGRVLSEIEVGMTFVPMKTTKTSSAQQLAATNMSSRNH